MRRIVVFVLFCLALAAAGRLTDAEIETYLKTMLVPGKYFQNIEAGEGVYLRDLVKRLEAKRVLEIGTSTGYSGIWLAMGLRQTGGRLITIEINEKRHAAAEENFRATGLLELADLRLGDALVETGKIAGPFDLVFIDALKSDYLRYYEMVLPKMRRGGAIVAHNVKSHPKDMAGFLARVQSDPAVRTEIVTPGWQGFSVSYVK